MTTEPTEPPESTQEEEPPKKRPSLLGAALWYAQQGHPVFPLQPHTKTPFNRSHGVKEATLDPDQIRAWWTRTSLANIGLATGHQVDVVDIDGPQGQASRALHWCYDPLCREQGNRPQPPPEWTPNCRPQGHPGVFNQIESRTLGRVSTPRPGGMHLYIDPTGGKNWAGKLEGVDYRGMGGYVVAPPSTTPQGTYDWLTPLHTHTEGEPAQ